MLRLAGGDSAAQGDWGPSPGRPATERVLDDLLTARDREGARLAAMLRTALRSCASWSTQAAPLVPQLVEQQRTRFLERWQEAMGLAAAAPLPEARRTAP